MTHFHYAKLQREVLKIDKISLESFICKFQKDIQYTDLIWKQDIGLWCQLPYPGYPNGCPQYNKNPDCPPHSLCMKELLEGYDQYRLYYLQFRIADWAKERKRIHPDWTIKKCRNPRHWQNHLRSELSNFMRCGESSQIQHHRRFCYILGCGTGFHEAGYVNPSMEAVGINVIMTFKRLNLPIEVKPSEVVTLVSLFCYKAPQPSKTVLDKLLELKR